MYRCPGGAIHIQAGWGGDSDGDGDIGDDWSQAIKMMMMVMLKSCW